MDVKTNDNRPISELDLSVRAENALLRNGINTIGELREKTPLQLLRLQWLGEKSLGIIVSRLKQDVRSGNKRCLNCAHHGGMGAPPFKPSGECVPCQADTEQLRSRWTQKSAPAKFSREWERVEGHTFRLKVPGGWLVQIYNCELSPDGSNLNPSSPGLCFYPDPNHEWLLEEERKEN